MSGKGHPAPGRGAGASRPGTALYQAVKEHIRSRVQTGAWPPGARISSEHELVAELKVSRMTVHRALRELADEGLIQRVAGVGSFVAEPKPQSALLRVASLAEEIQARGHRHTFILLTAQREPARLEVAGALGLAPGDSVFHVRGLHLEEGVPVQFEDRFVNPAAAPGFLDQDFARTLPGEVLLRTVPLDEVEHLVDAVGAGPEEAQALAVAPGSPCLVLTRRTWSQGRCVTFVRCVHPGPRFRLGTRFRPDGSLGVG